jgi:hypothetical protein
MDRNGTNQEWTEKCKAKPTYRDYGVFRATLYCAHMKNVPMESASVTPQKPGVSNDATLSL